MQMTGVEKAYIAGDFCITWSAFPYSSVGEFICSHKEFAEIETKYKAERIVNIRKNEDTYYSKNELIVSSDGPRPCQKCGIRPANVGRGSTIWFPKESNFNVIDAGLMSLDSKLNLRK